MTKGAAMHCPGCDVPVMTSPPPGVKYSDKSPDASKATGHSSDVPTSSSLIETSAINAPITAESKSGTSWEDDLTAPFRSLEEEKKAYDRARKHKLDEASKKIGEMLLQGYAMLNVECPSSSCGSAPLMKAQGGNPECAICGASYTTGPMGSLVPIEKTTKSQTSAPASATGEQNNNHRKPSSIYPTIDLHLTTTKKTKLCFILIVAESKVAAPVPPPSPSPPTAMRMEETPRISDARMKKGLNASDRIGRYLVQGWALLDETCPSEQCADVIPLVKNKSGRVSSMNSTLGFYCYLIILYVILA
jgi:uncharacterized Zn finger protein (UPF0148 family)